MTEANTEFLNVDLELEGPRDLSALVRALGDVFVLHQSAEPPWVAKLEVSGMQTEPDGTVRALLDRVEGLDESGRRLWDECTQRRFSFGIQGGEGPRCAEYPLAADTVRRLAAAGAEVSLAVYGARHDD